MGLLQRIKHWNRTAMAPVLGPRIAETCPACGRDIPGAIIPGAPGLVGTRWPAKSRAELQRLCPIDGPVGRSHAPQPRSLAELRATAGDLQRQLREGRDRGWSNLFTTALQKDDGEFLELMGHSVAVLLRHGPLGDLQTTREDIEQLLVDTVAMWPQHVRGD